MIVPGEETTFTCTYTSIFDVIEEFQWLVNGTLLEDLNKTEGIEAENNIVGHLHFINITVEYNGTTIQCIIHFTSGESVPSNHAILFVQGKEKIMRLAANCSNTLCRSPSCCWFSDCYSYSTGLHHLPHLDTSLLPGYN